MNVNPLIDGTEKRPRLVTKEMLFDMAERYNQMRHIRGSGSLYYVATWEEDGKTRYQLARNG